MNLLFWLMFLLVSVEYVTLVDITECPNVKVAQSFVRKRRYITFPDKSNMIMTISLVKAFMTHAPSGWNIALEIDVLFPLPPANFTNAFFRRKKHHRQRREFWDNLQSALDLHNLNGRSCILRSICEADSTLAPPGKSLVHDILRAVFTVPANDEEFMNEMRGYYDEFSNTNFCATPHECPISLLHSVLSLNKRF